jgi:D-glycero-D-manno-heptose 1,7-bisphosphate phosphatase
VKPSNKAVFLDKDGTLIEDEPYSAGIPRFLPGVFPALRKLNGYLLVVVTNQSGIAKGLMTHDDLDAQRFAVEAELEEQGIRLAGFYYCPHEGGCECRKPFPGMLFQAARELDIALGQSYMIGDKPSDIDAGWRAGTYSLQAPIPDAVGRILRHQAGKDRAHA